MGDRLAAAPAGATGRTASRRLGAVTCALSWDGARGTAICTIPAQLLDEDTARQVPSHEADWRMVAEATLELAPFNCDCGKALSQCLHVTSLRNSLQLCNKLSRAKARAQHPELRGLAAQALKELLYWLSDSVRCVVHDVPVVIVAQDAGVHGGDEGDTTRLSRHYQAALSVDPCHPRRAGDETRLTLLGPLAVVCGRH